MKKQLFSLILFTLFSCEKDAPIPEENKQLATSFQATILEHEYRLTSYKSDVPIDYDPTQRPMQKLITGSMFLTTLKMTK